MQNTKVNPIQKCNNFQQKQNNHSKENSNNPEQTKNILQSSHLQLQQQMYDINANYLADKIKISQTPKPSKYHYKMPGRTGYTEYNKSYTKLAHSIEFASQNLIKQSTKQVRNISSFYKMSPIITPKSNTLNVFISNYKKDYRESTSKDQNQYKRKIKTQYVPNDSPFISNKSSYNETYLHWNYDKPAQAIKNKSNQLKFTGQTKKHSVYADTYVQKKIPECNPIKHKDNKMITMNEQIPPTESTYQQNFSKQLIKQNSKPITSFKPLHYKEKSKNKNSHKMKYKTQYNGSYVGNNNQKNTKNQDYNCMTTKQLKDYILNQI